MDCSFRCSEGRHISIKVLQGFVSVDYRGNLIIMTRILEHGASTIIRGLQVYGGGASFIQTPPGSTCGMGKERKGQEDARASTNHPEKESMRTQAVLAPE